MPLVLEEFGRRRPMSDPLAPDPRAPEPSGLHQLLSFEPLMDGWIGDGGDAAAARRWTSRQVAAFAALVADDAGWRAVLEIFDRGRGVDSWLATDWPSGFDELLLCAPLCQLVEFDCARCTIGARQEANSCAHPASVFGSIGTYLQERDRERLQRHLEHVVTMLDPGESWRWDLGRRAAVPGDPAPDDPRPRGAG